MEKSFDNLKGIDALEIIKRLREAANIATLSNLVQNTYYTIATTEWGQEPSPDSPYLVPTNAELPNEAAVKTNDDAVCAVIDGMENIALRAGVEYDGKWLVETLEECIAEIEGAPVLVHEEVEFPLYRGWAKNRYLNDPRHKNLVQGFDALGDGTKQYDRRIAYALFSEMKKILADG